MSISHVVWPTSNEQHQHLAQNNLSLTRANVIVQLTMTMALAAERDQHQSRLPSALRSMIGSIVVQQHLLEACFHVLMLLLSCPYR